jgi:hypothetical protein
VDQRLDHRRRAARRREQHGVGRVRKALGLALDLDQVGVARDGPEGIEAFGLDARDRILAAQALGDGVPSFRIGVGLRVRGPDLRRGQTPT